MKIAVSEVQILPIKPENGLVGFASVVINNSLYLGSIGIHTRPDGTARITYPTKKVRDRELNIYHPINKEAGLLIEKAVTEAYQSLFERSDENDRHRKAHHQNG